MSKKILMHIPHSSMYIPKEYRDSILLDDKSLNNELIKMTDLYVDELFSGENSIVFPVSRLICDVERFRDDKDEPMSNLGMGAVYTKTSTGASLRDIKPVQVEAILNKYYDVHHHKLAEKVRELLTLTGKCTIIDCHSFSEDMEYTGVDSKSMPDICIGADNFHTPAILVDKLRVLCEAKGYSIGINTPFSGSLVPLEYYNKTKDVISIMIEINKKLYTHANGEKNDNFNDIQDLCFEITDIIKCYK